MVRVLPLLSLLFLVSTGICHSIEKRGISSRIVGGIPARAGQFPFAAAITLITPTGNYFCSGSLVNTEWILTAGQCVYGATSFIIRLGTTSRVTTDDNMVTLTTETYVVHPDFDPATLSNDLGAIRLREYIRYTDYIRPVSYFTSTPLPDSSTVVTLGWGETSDADAELATDLNYIFLSTMSNEQCRIYYGNAITDNMVCVVGSFNEGTCLGDSGAPLVQYTASGNLYFVGVSSFYSGNGCESIEPSGYTRVAPYRDWINTVTLA